jgi:REP element-mobilizing transposase RayT
MGIAHRDLMNARHGDETLRRGRWSQRGCTYFVTACTENRGVGLHAASLAPTLRKEIIACERDGHWRVLGAVIMPEHLHLLVKLTGELPLSRIVARVKMKTRVALWQHGLRWQGNFYEHRLRDGDPVKEVLWYLLLNPYQAGLVAVAETYPWFWLHPDEAVWFRADLDNDRPYPEWLR